MNQNELSKKQHAVADELQEKLSKSFQTGYGITPETQVDAGALRREILDDQITMLTWGNNDLVFYRDVARRPAESTVIKYDVFLRHGKVGHSRFVREIGVASVSDPNIRQKTVTMKYISDTKNMSLASSLVNNIADPGQILTEDAISVVAKTIEWASFYGDASLTSEVGGEGLEFDGLAKLIDADNVIDAKGAHLDEKLLNLASVKIGKGFGTATDAYMPIGVHSDFVTNILGRQMQLMQDNSGNVNTGFSVNGFYSSRGFIRLHGSTVMENELILDETLIPQPNAPQPATVKATVKTDQKGKFTKEEDRAGLSYKVVVHSDEAESAPSEAQVATVTNATDGVELKITVNSMYQQSPQFVSIYRQGKETGMYYLIKRVALKDAQEDGSLVFVDKNETLPETADVFVGEMSPQVLHLFELLPMMKLPLAQINASITFAVLWYGALALRAPKKWARIKNVSYLALK
ncbi:major capsid protein [Staphylococcus phage qdsa001]|nr:major capsid protein [Staphylococcus phage qdsa001]QXV86291.1 major capsid protein [Staphylococcus phage SAPYZU_15]UGL60702.1 major capsid protein [Staphylococcus phage vB_SauM-HM01]UVD42493.1 major capsid protein [Staphylococcus phage vB_SauM-V1SA19]WBF47952.1 structure protein [Staphylococcus phage SSP49]BEU75392.1 major head protein [Staphylococcus phage phiRNIID]